MARPLAQRGARRPPFPPHWVLRGTDGDRGLGRLVGMGLATGPATLGRLGRETPQPLAQGCDAGTRGARSTVCPWPGRAARQPPTPAPGAGSSQDALQRRQKPPRRQLTAPGSLAPVLHFPEGTEAPPVEARGDTGPGGRRRGNRSDGFRRRDRAKTSMGVVSYLRGVGSAGVLCCSTSGIFPAGVTAMVIVILVSVRPSSASSGVLSLMRVT